MLRLFYAETYKLRKSKSFYICVISAIAFVFLMYSMLAIADNIQKGRLENGTGGVIVSVNNKQSDLSSSSIWDTVSIMDMLQETFSGDVIGIILAIFASIFVICEFSSGMLKNIVGKGCSRGSIYLARLAAAILASILISLAGIAATLACGWLFAGIDPLSGSIWKHLPAYTGLQLLLITAITSIFVLIGEISRNLAAGISLGICTAAFPALLLNILDMQFADSSITPSQFWPLTRLSACPFEGLTAGYAAETFAVTLFWIVLAAGLGIWHFYKTDIR